MVSIDAHDFDGHGGHLPGCRGCELATLRARVQQLEQALADHAIQCPQCQSAALAAALGTTLPAALTPSPEDTINGPSFGFELENT
jgi:hypothetical protein